MLFNILLGVALEGISLVIPCECHCDSLKLGSTSRKKISELNETYNDPEGEDNFLKQSLISKKIIPKYFGSNLIVYGINGWSKQWRKLHTLLGRK